MIAAYYFIFSVDGYKEAKGSWALKRPGSRWKRTEYSNEQEESEGTFYHRKFVKISTNLKSLKELFYRYNLHSGPDETMGAITEYGHLPAISFSGELERSEGGPIWTNIYIGIMCDSEKDYIRAVSRIKKIHRQAF